MPPVDLVDLEPEASSVELLWSLLDDTTRMRRAEIGALADDALSWTPFEGMHSIGAVLMHIIDAEVHWIHEVVGGVPRSPEDRILLQSDATDQWNRHWAPAPALDHAALLRMHDAVRARSKVLAGDFVDATATFPLGDRSATLRWVLKHVATHEAYHYGQIELLRQLHEWSRS
ncbi:MAG: DinB family protein [Armatimonadota bacterium]